MDFFLTGGGAPRYDGLVVLKNTQHVCAPALRSHPYHFPAFHDLSAALNVYCMYMHAR